MDQKLVKTNICFSHFSDKCFSHFPIPKSVFWRVMGRNGHEPTLFPFLFIHFFPFFPIHKSKFRGILVKNGIGPPLALFVYIFSYLLVQISKRFGKRWSWTPTEPAAYPFVIACVFGHSIRQWDLMELGSGSKRYVTNICCSKMLDHSNRHAY